MELPLIFFMPNTYKGDQYVGFFDLDLQFKRIDIALSEKDTEIECGIYEKEELAMELVAFTNYQKIELEDFKEKLNEAMKIFEIR